MKSKLDQTTLNFFGNFINVTHIKGGGGGGEQNEYNLTFTHTCVHVALETEINMILNKHLFSNFLYFLHFLERPAYTAVNKVDAKMFCVF